MLLLLIILAVIFFGLGIVLKTLGIAVGLLFGSGLGVVLLVIALVLYLLNR